MPFNYVSILVLITLTILVIQKAENWQVFKHQVVCHNLDPWPQYFIIFTQLDMRCTVSCQAWQKTHVEDNNLHFAVEQAWDDVCAWHLVHCIQTSTVLCTTDTCLSVLCEGSRYNEVNSFVEAEPPLAVKHRCSQTGWNHELAAEPAFAGLMNNSLLRALLPLDWPSTSSRKALFDFASWLLAFPLCALLPPTSATEPQKTKSRAGCHGCNQHIMMTIVGRMLLCR